MHLIFFMRGIINQIEILKTALQYQFWKWKRINLDTGKEEEILVQGALRPSVLGAWEYVFPKECLAEVCCMIGITDSPYRGEKAKARMEKIQLGFLRKIFGCRKIPKEIYAEAAKIPQSVIISGIWRGLSHCIIPGTAVHCIGIKDDDMRDFDFTPQGLGRYHQEAL